MSHLKRMIAADSEWYAKNGAAILNQFIDTVLS